MTSFSRIQLRQDTAANWAEANTLLAMGEEAIDLTTGRKKRGNGVDRWNDLPFETTAEVEAEIASQLPEAVDTSVVANLAGRAFSWNDDGEGGGYPAVGDTPIGPTRPWPSSTWSGTVGRPDVDANADHGAVADAPGDQDAALQAALDATPDGGRLRIRPGQYKVGDVGLMHSGKSIYIDAPGVTLVQNANVDVLTLIGEHDALLSVSSLTPTVFDFQEGNGIPGVVMELSVAPSWSRGDVVKVVADDEIPGARPTNTASKNRVGQFFIVHSVSGTTVTLSGELHDPFTTNIRVARVVKHTAKIDGLRIESNDPANYTAAGIKLVGLFAPEVDVTFGLMPSADLWVQSCYRHSVKLVADGGNIAPAAGKYTYAAFDVGGECGQYDINAGYVRHAYDDGATITPADSPSLWDYGRSAGHHVTGVAHATLSTAWSTHTQSRDVTFFNCEAWDSPIAFALRGRNHNILNGVTKGCKRGLSIFDEDRVGQDSSSFGHYIDGLVLRETPYAVQIKANTEDATAPTYGQREATPTIIKNLYADGVGAGEAAEITVTNQTVILENVRLVGSVAFPNSHAAIKLANADVTLRDVEIDWLKNTAGSSLRCIETTSDSVVKGDDTRWLITSDVASRASANVVSSAATLWDVFDFQQSFNTTFPGDTGAFGAAGSKFDYRESSTGVGTSYRSVSDSNLTNATYLAMLGMSKRPVIYLRATGLTANRTLAKLPNGAFRGQQLIITNANTAIDFALTIGHGTSSFTTSHIRGGSISLWGKQSIGYMWDGSTWQQIIEPGLLSGTATLDFPLVGAQSHQDQTMTVMGAALGDVVALEAPGIAGVLFTAKVSAANTVTVRAHNYTSGAIDPASGTFKATIVR